LDLGTLKKSLSSFNWRSLQKLTSPQAANDLNHFLEKLPQNAGQTMLIIAGVTWAVGGAMGLYTTVQLQQLTKLRAELQDAQSLLPAVPVIRDISVDRNSVAEFVARTKDTYKDLVINANGTSIVISADSTGKFGQFREAVGHVQNGGSGWRVSVDRLCVGRECDKQPLTAALKINKVSVDKAE
jgi:hypothetical protein